jgi:sigma-B regulation protein RsbU (phosphoserine phosphatase)
MRLDRLLQEYRRCRMVRFSAWTVAYGLALWLTRTVLGGAPVFLWVVFWLCFIPVAVYGMVRLVGVLRRRFLWHLRRRLILAYFFIAVVPIVLILLLVGLAAYIINGQFASFLVASNFRHHVESLDQLSHLMVHQAELVPQGSPRQLIDQLQNFVVADLRGHGVSYPGLEITIRVGGQVRAFRPADGAAVKPVEVPSWLHRDDFSDIVLDGKQVLLRSLQRQPTRQGELVLIVSQPITPELLDQIGAGIGPVGVVLPELGGSEAGTSPGPPKGVNVSLSAGQPPRQGVILSSDQGPRPAFTIRSKSLQVPPPASRFDYTVYNAQSLMVVPWNATEEKREGVGIFYVTSRVTALDTQLVSTLGFFSSVYWYAFAVLGLLFLLLEFLALVIGIRLTRSMTKTVDKLQKATERVKLGDFSYRIGLPATDQLSALGEAFDGMTASVERLLKESLEKTRLEGELEIAREVQHQLFPRTAPQVAGLQIHGVCKPARVVSGDYYDFLELGADRLGLVLGDISGKGISAALLMAAIQSSLHAQFYNGHSPHGAGDLVPISTAEVVGRLNRQLYASTPREKYATFFYAVYDGSCRRLTYTTAGHPPPILLRRGSVERLAAGGTVVGLFATAKYDQAVVQLEPGDLLLAYTDGITEPENSYGEEFGEERLLEVLRRAAHAPPETLVEEIYRSVSEWTGSPELQDDMTLLAAKAV